MTTIDPTRTALVAVHMQNDIVGPDGAFAPFFRAEIDRVGTLATAARLLDAARAAGVPVVYTRVAWRPDHSDLHANSPLLNIVVQQNCLVDGTPGAAITDELAPQDTDRVVTHQRVGGFHDSELDEVLRARESTPSPSSAWPPTPPSKAPPAPPRTWATASSWSATPAAPPRPKPMPPRSSHWACSPRSPPPTS